MVGTTSRAVCSPLEERLRGTLLELTERTQELRCAGFASALESLLLAAAAVADALAQVRAGTSLHTEEGCDGLVS